MWANLIVLVMIIAGVAYFYLKCNIVTSLTNVLAALLGCILAFSYYEQLAGLLASEKWAVTWIQSAAFLLIFFFGFLFIRVLSGFLAKGDFEVSKIFKIIITICCGIFTGIIVSGVLLIALALSPIPPGSVYSRYPVSQPIYIAISYPPMINADGFVASLYSWVSRSSLSSRKSFAVLHADYLSRVHLNRYALSDDVPSVCSPKAVKLPGGNVQPVRLWDFPDQPRMTVVRLGISGNPIAKGGAADTDGTITLMPAQVRLIVKEQDQDGKYTGKAEVIYPAGHLSNESFEPLNLNMKISEEARNLGPDRTLWMDLAFPVPPQQRAVLLSFKQNAIIELPKAVPTSEEIEKALSSN